MKLHVLGPIEAVNAAGERVDLGGPTQRRLAAMLAVKAGQVVSSERLGETLGLSPGGVRTAVRRLRQVLGPDAVETVPPGYVLRLPPPTSRSSLRWSRTPAGATGRGRGAPHEGVESVVRCRVEEFADEAWAQAAAAGLDEQRVAAEEARGEARLACGGFARGRRPRWPAHPGPPVPGRPARAPDAGARRPGSPDRGAPLLPGVLGAAGRGGGHRTLAQLRDLESRIATGWSDRPAGSRTVPPAPHGNGDVPALPRRRARRCLGRPPVRGPGLLGRPRGPRPRRGRPGGVGSSCRHRATGCRRCSPGSTMRCWRQVAAQRSMATTAWPGGCASAVGMGLHSGDATHDRARTTSAPLAWRSRLADLAHGGQVLGSGATADLAPATVEIVPVGRHRLPGQSQRVRISQLAGEGLPRHFPPPSDPFGRQPALGPLVVRRAPPELADLRAALALSPSLVTIIGVGGIGKTRLALEAGRSHDAARRHVARRARARHLLGSGRRRRRRRAWASRRSGRCHGRRCCRGSRTGRCSSSSTTASMCWTQQQPRDGDHLVSDRHDGAGHQPRADRRSRGEHLFPLGPLSLPGPGVEQRRIWWSCSSTAAGAGTGVVRRTWRPSRRSAAASTASRWPSSSPPPGRGRCRPATSPTTSTTASACSRAAPAGRRAPPDPPSRHRLVVPPARRRRPAAADRAVSLRGILRPRRRRWRVQRGCRRGRRAEPAVIARRPVAPGAQPRAGALPDARDHPRLRPHTPRRRRRVQGDPDSGTPATSATWPDRSGRHCGRPLNRALDVRSSSKRPTTCAAARWAHDTGTSTSWRSW